MFNTFYIFSRYSKFSEVTAGLMLPIYLNYPQTTLTVIIAGNWNMLEKALFV